MEGAYPKVPTGANVGYSVRAILLHPVQVYFEVLGANAQRAAGGVLSVTGLRRGASSGLRYQSVLQTQEPVCQNIAGHTEVHCHKHTNKV